MSRVIKFRTWDIEDKRFLEHTNADPHLAGYGTVYCYERTPEGDTMTNERHMHGRIVIEQFTGLTDSQGREIYEGDLIDFETRGRPHGPERESHRAALVWWDDEFGCWTFGRWTHANCDEPFDYGVTMQDGIDEKSIKVVGNRHENAKLFKS